MIALIGLIRQTGSLCVLRVATFMANIWRPKLRGRMISYLRSSSLPRSGLDLDNQRAAVERVLAGCQARVIAEFIEQENQTCRNRPQLAAAIDLCRSTGARLVIAKLGRLRHDIEFLERLWPVRFIAADFEDAHTLYVLLARERKRRSELSRRMQDTLAVLKADGVALGGARENSEGLRLGPTASAISRRRRARWRAEVTMNSINDIRRSGILPLRKIAERLNARGISAPKGGKWSAAQVRAVIKLCESD